VPSVLTLSPNARQRQFFAEKAKFILYGGAKGGGKSWAIRWKQILRRLKYPGSKGLLLRRTYPELYRTHIEKIAQEIPKGMATYDNQRHTLRFANGSTLEFASAQYERDILQFQGAEYDDIGLDEATQFTEYQFNMLRSVIRTIRPDIETQIYLSANPGGIGHGWVKRTFVEPDFSKFTAEQIAEYRSVNAFVPAKVYDNPVLMKNDPYYLKTLQSLPEALRRMYLDGDWNIFEGQVFNEWRQDKHVTDKFEFPLDVCKKIVGFDWGYASPGCAIFLAYTPENSQGVSRVYAYRELYLTQKTPEQWALAIKAFADLDNIEYIVLPHDCYVNEGRESIADTFQRIIRKPIRRGATLQKNARKNRLAITHQYLSDAKDGKPLMQFHPKLLNTIRTLPELVYADNDPEDINSDGEDHAYDALSLALLSKVIFALQSGAVKPDAPVGRMPVTWRMDEQGVIQGSNFWDAFKQIDYAKVGRTWEHK